MKLFKKNKKDEDYYHCAKPACGFLDIENNYYETEDEATLSTYDILAKGLMENFKGECERTIKRDTGPLFDLEVIRHAIPYINFSEVSKIYDKYQRSLEKIREELGIKVDTHGKIKKES